MRSRLLFPALGAVLLLGVAGAAWWATRPPPPPPPAAPDQKYQDIDRAKYEEWMQELGYTE